MHTKTQGLKAHALLQIQELALARGASARDKSKRALHQQARARNALLLTQELALARDASARGKNKGALRHQAPVRRRC